MLEIQHLSKSFDSRQILRDISFSLSAGETFAVLGRSGCGKTTLLKIIAGLLDGEGNILLSGHDLSLLPPQQRGMVYLYQEALLFPHLNVFENIAFGLRLRRKPEIEIRNRVESMLVHLGLEDQGQKMPQSLSGGQKQRVAFGRALVIEPGLLLLDEPFGALDVETRNQMQQFFKQIAAQQGISSIFVTHDLKEALILGTRWGYLEDGGLRYFDTRRDFVNDPGTGVKAEIKFWEGI